MTKAQAEAYAILIRSQGEIAEVVEGNRDRKNGYHVAVQASDRPRLEHCHTPQEVASVIGRWHQKPDFQVAYFPK